MGKKSRSIRARNCQALRAQCFKRLSDHGRSIELRGLWARRCGLVAYDVAENWILGGTANSRLLAPGKLLHELVYLIWILFGPMHDSRHLEH